MLTITIAGRPLILDPAALEFEEEGTLELAAWQVEVGVGALVLASSELMVGVATTAFGLEVGVLFGALGASTRACGKNIMVIMVSMKIL